MRDKIIKRPTFIFFIFCFMVQFSYGQKIEVNFNVYSGLFSFYGDGSTSESWINFNPYTFPQKVTSNVYGKKSGFPYSIELQGQRTTRRENIYGLGFSFETLTSKVNIDTLTENGFFYRQYPASGETTLRNTFVTINPFVGHRFLYRSIIFDLLVGTDLSFCLKSREQGHATVNNKNYSLQVDNEKEKPLIDIRPRIQFTTQYDKFGFIIGYSLGLINYQTQNNLKAYTSFLRFGLSYQLK